MKFIFLFILTFPLYSFAVDCRFSGGKTVRGETGQVTSTTFNPKVLPTAGLLTVEKSLSDIWITSMSDFNISLIGYSCPTAERREGFDCFTVTPNSGRQFKTFTSSNGQKQLILELPLGIPGNLLQEDTYICNK